MAYKSTHAHIILSRVFEFHVLLVIRYVSIIEVPKDTGRPDVPTDLCANAT